MIVQLKQSAGVQFGMKYEGSRYHGWCTQLTWRMLQWLVRAADTRESADGNVKI